MKNVERFSNRVADYIKYRPSYPPEILELFRNEMSLEKDSIIADIGSGTGISAKLFLEKGNRVFGVEPNAAMRAAAEEFLKEFADFKSVNGNSENTTIKADSVDFIVAAQAFHWFDREKTRSEFNRILRQNGFAVLMWNERQLNSNEFLRGYEQLLIEFGTDYETVRHENITKETLSDFFQADFKEKTFPNRQTLNFEGLKGRMLSSSYMPTAENQHFAPMIENLKTLFAQHNENGKIDILYDTNIFYGKI